MESHEDSITVEITVGGDTGNVWEENEFWLWKMKPVLR